MSLLRLPPETLSEVFDLIGSSFFHEDLSRLTVCRKWFEYALPACFKTITLSQENLRSLAASVLIQNTSPLKNSLEYLGLELTGYQARNSTSDPQQHTQTSNSQEANTATDKLVKTWVQALNSDLDQLATVVRKSHRLRILRVRAWPSPSPEQHPGPGGYLSISAMHGLLSVENLRVLKLDLSGSSLNPAGHHQGTGYHICPAISAVLGTLRTLHLRMRSICPDVLNPRDANSKLHLSVVVINLSLTTNLPGITAAAHSNRCGSQGAGLLQLKADMQEQAEALVTRMSGPRIVRILTHSLPQFETQSLDVLTGKTMILYDDMAWDADGKTVKEDSEPESEFLDDDELAAFLDD